MKKLWPDWAGLLLAAVIIIGSIIFVARKQHAASEKYEADRQHWCASTANLTAKQSESCESKGPDRSDYLPWGYELATWPEGITAWAIIFTGFMIFWQAWETRKAAEAATKSIGLQTQSLRPRLSISNLVKDVFGEALAGDWVTVNLKIENSGGMPAYGMIAETWIEFIAGIPPYKFTMNARYRVADPLNVHTGKPQGFFIPLYRKLTISEMQQMANFEGAICFRVRMRYRAFEEDVHTDEAFVARPKEMESISGYTSAT